MIKRCLYRSDDKEKDSKRGLYERERLRGFLSEYTEDNIQHHRRRNDEPALEKEKRMMWNTSLNEKNHIEI